MKKVALPLVAAVAALALASCSSTPTPAVSPASSSIPTEAWPEVDGVAPGEEATPLVVPGKFWFATNGGCFGKFDLPSESAPDGVEEARKAAKVPELTYVKVVLDCRQANGGANMYKLDGYTAAGKKISFEDVNSLVAGWPDTDADLVNSIDSFVDGGQVASIWMATSEPLPEEFARFTTQPEGMGEPVQVMSQADAQGAPLDFEDPND